MLRLFTGCHLVIITIPVASGWFAGRWWLGSRVVRRSWVQIAVVTLSGNSLRQIVHTHHAFVHQVAKLVAALLRVAGVTAGTAESNGSGFMTHVTCRLTAKNWDQLENPTLGNRASATFFSAQ